MQILKTCLNYLTIKELSSLISDEVVDALDKIGIEATKSRLTEIIIENYSISILQKRKARETLFNKEKVLENLNISDQEASELISRSWTQNYEKIAALFDLEVSESDLNESHRAPTLISKHEQPLMSYQNWMRKRVKDKFAKPTTQRLLVHMPTGAGKTSTAMQIIFDQLRELLPSDATVIWMAHSDELCEQAVQSFLKAWPNQQLGKSTIWRAWGGQSDLSEFTGNGCNFVVTSFQTLFSWQKSSKNSVFKNINFLKRKCDFLIVDEAHLSTAPTYASAIEYITGVQSRIMGLTATPGRHGVDGEAEQTAELVDFFENNLLRMTNDNGEEVDDPIRFLQSKRVLSDIELVPMQGSKVQLSKAQLKSCVDLFDLPESVLTMIGDDHVRTLNVAKEVLEQARQKKLQTIVFCPSKSNSQVMAEYLKLNGCSAASITGETDPHTRRQNLEKFKSGEIKVITNYGVLTTGFDAPNIGAVVIARPTLSVVLYSQMIGRGIRGPLFGGTEKSVIVNVMDNITNLPDYRSAFTYFDEFYNK